MKKLVLLVVAMSVIPLVEAITLFGEEVSMLVLIPTIFILILLVLFISMIVRDKIKNKSKDLKSADIPRPAPPDLTEKPVIEKSPMKTPKSIQKPKIDYLKEIDAIERDSNGIEIKHKMLNKLIRRFFSDYLGVNLGFTFEELEKELKKRNKEIICFSDNLSSITYSPEEISKEKLTELIGEFKDVVLSVKENRPLPPEFKKDAKDKKKKINALLKKGKKLIGKDTSKAIEKYKEISKLYNTLPDKDKEAIRPSIIDFYSKLGL